MDQGTFPNTLTLFLPDYLLYVMTVYRPPSYTHADNCALINYILDLCAGKEFLLVGDFNLPSIAWNDNVVDLNISGTDALFLDLFNIIGLSQWVMEPTFISSGNILDLVLTSEDDRILDIKTYPPFHHCGHALIKFLYLYHSY